MSERMEGWKYGTMTLSSQSISAEGSKEGRISNYDLQRESQESRYRVPYPNM